MDDMIEAGCGSDNQILLTIQNVYEYGLNVCKSFPVDGQGLGGTTIGEFDRNGDLQVINRHCQGCWN